MGRAEIDLVRLADRDYILFHDSVLDRGSTGSGPVSELTSDAARGSGSRAYRHDEDQAPAAPTDHALGQLSDVVAMMQSIRPRPSSSST